jgi:hypothetical protein
VVGASPAVKAAVQVTSETTLEFDLGLFRCGEFVKFEALAEVPTVEKKGGLVPAISLEESLRFDHRIADTGRIKTADRPAAHQGILLPIILLAVLVLFLPVLYLFAISAAGKIYIIDRGGRDITVLASPLASGLIDVVGTSEEFHEVLTMQEFRSIVKITNRSPGVIAVVFTVFFSMLISTACWAAYITVKAIKFRRFTSWGENRTATRFAGERIPPEGREE